MAGYGTVDSLTETSEFMGSWKKAGIKISALRRLPGGIGYRRSCSNGSKINSVGRI